MQDLDAIERSQKKLFASLKSDIALFEGRKSREIAAYERAFRRSLPKKIHATHKRDLLRSIAKSKVILIGDFHPFRQSQKGFLRVLGEAAPFVARPVIGLECLQQEHQTAIDDYLARSITLEELREESEFERHWPFSWENYKEILVFARERNLPVLALNVRERKRTARTLRARDRAAAGRIAQEVLQRADSTVFVLYGELHLASPHLPADLRRAIGDPGKVLVIHQNEQGLYWRAPLLRNGQKPEILRLSQKEFCVLNSVPWVKLRSYLDWLEGSPNQETDESPDLPSSLRTYAALLAEACRIECRIRDDVQVLGPEQLAEGKLSVPLSLSAAERTLLRHSLRFQRTNFLPGAKVVLLPTASTNALFEAASYLLWHSLRQGPSGIAKGGLPIQAGHFLIGYLGSKVLNPKRKCNEMQDLKDILTASSISPKQKAKAKVVRRALRILGPLLGPLHRMPSAAGCIPGTGEIEACRLAGYLLGERLFHALLKDSSLLTLVHQWFQSSSSGEIANLLLDTADSIGRQPAFRKADRF